MKITEYSAEWKVEWDELVDRSRNGMFLFNRDYMEYHADRFDDLSLVFTRDGKPVALLPGNASGDTYFSHQGLTFGGLILEASATTTAVMEMFPMLLDHLRDRGMARMVYKPVPHIYHAMPSDDDLYALFRAGARLIRRDVSSAVPMSRRMKPSTLRTRMVKKASKNGVVVERSDDLASFMAIVNDVLVSRHGTRAVHSLDEIELLASRFPDNIKLFASFVDGAMLAGALVYESSMVAHCQYTVASDDGRELGALDAVTDYLLNEEYRDHAFVDFGISTERDGLFLNEGLIGYKESFGARAIVYDWYELDLSSR